MTYHINHGFAHLQATKALHDEITKQAANIEGKVYLFFDKIQEVKDWEKCINSFRVTLDCDIYITGSNAKLLSGDMPYLANIRYEDAPSKLYLHDLFNFVQFRVKFLSVTFCSLRSCIFAENQNHCRRILTLSAVDAIWGKISKSGGNGADGSSHTNDLRALGRLRRRQSGHP